MSHRTSFEIPPPPIHPRDIKDEVTADVVVVGSGVAGMTAAISSAEAGARTILLEKSPTYNYRGGHNAAIASSIQKKLGLKIDKDEIISAIMEFGAYRSDQRVVTTWADNCDQVLEWLIKMAAEAKIKVEMDPTTKPWYFPNYPTIHVFQPKHQETLAGLLNSNVLAKGVDLRYNTPAVRLLRDGGKRVRAVIARNADGSCTQFNVNRAIVLCTGDYGNNREMVDAYCWESLKSTACHYEPAVNTGDGHKMAMWIGAAIDEPPHCVMLFDWAVWSKDGLFNLARQPWLYVNLNGERFMNEDLPYNYACCQILQQPGRIWWSVWDSKWEQEIKVMKSQCCKNMGPPMHWWQSEWLEHALKNEYVLTAPTIEELAQKMEVPVEKFKATTDRYTELAHLGKDLDFGKHPDRLTTLEKPLFYACKMEVRFMVTLGGLRINNRLQVLDKEQNIIPGLYAAGNVSGSFFGHQYPTTVPGLTHSRAWTFGRLAGLSAAAEKW